MSAVDATRELPIPVDCIVKGIGGGVVGGLVGTVIGAIAGCSKMTCAAICGIYSAVICMKIPVDVWMSNNNHFKSLFVSQNIVGPLLSSIFIGTLYGTLTGYSKKACAQVFLMSEAVSIAFNCLRACYNRSLFPVMNLSQWRVCQLFAVVNFGGLGYMLHTQGLLHPYLTVALGVVSLVFFVFPLIRSMTDSGKEVLKEKGVIVAGT